MGGGGEGFFTETKIALFSPNPFVHDEKGALSIEKARPAQGLASGYPGPLPSPLPFSGDDYASYLCNCISHSEKKGEKAGRDSNAQRMVFVCCPA